MITKFLAAGLEGSGTLDRFSFKNCAFEGKEAGAIRHANDWLFEGFSVTGQLEIARCQHVNP
jgi:hypothetical protein